MQNEIPGWFSTAVAAVMGTLATVIATLFKMNETKNAVAISEMKERLQTVEAENKICIEDRTKMQIQIAQLELTVCRAQDEKA